MIPQVLYKQLGKLRTYCASFGLSEEEQKDDQLLLTTFIHKTYSADYRESMQVPHNERLEFLGDSILGSHVAQILYTLFPQQAESQLTLSKIYLVKESTLADIARKIELGAYMFLGKGEEKSGGRNKDSVLSDGLEALIAYLFLVGGESISHAFIKNYVITILDDGIIPGKSFKSKLQELCQKYWKELPIYEITEKEVEKTGNVLLYEAIVSVQGSNKGMGQGPSKKKAQELAAEDAYENLRKEII